MRILLIFAVLTLCSERQIAAEGVRRVLEYAPAPVENPLKGLVPYRDDVRTTFPHSLEFDYIAYSALVKGPNEFDWEPLEQLLDEIAGRGHQAVFRVYLEYPGKRGAIPEFLAKGGMKVTRWKSDSSADSFVETPDYQYPPLGQSLKTFIRELGRKYDGDPRIGFITAGLLGLWGEWHTYPREQLFAGVDLQNDVLDAYQAAFKSTPILLRYPVGEGHESQASNAKRPFGYHDDSFAWATLDTGRKQDNWFYMAALKEAGVAAESKWKSQPIGGEIRPEAWGKVFDDKPGDKRIQDFRKCVEATHVTWLMDSGLFRKNVPPQRILRALEQVRRMGYEFHAPAWTVDKTRVGQIEVSLEIENRGVAPFYHDWKSEWGLLKDGEPVKTFACTGRLTGLLPGDPPRTWSDSLDVSQVMDGEYTLAIRILNPLRGGHPLQFANVTQDVGKDWLRLGTVQLP